MARDIKLRDAWRESKRILWEHRRRLSLAFLLTLFSRMAGLAVPASTKFLIDDVIGGGRGELLETVAMLLVFAIVVQAASAFVMSQIIGVAAQKTINDLRTRLQSHVTRLPVKFFQSEHTGSLIARIMTDPEAVRNLVGTGLIQLVGGSLTAVLALGVLLYLNWRLTFLTVFALSLFAGVVTYAFIWMRPLYRERREIYAGVSGRLAESLSGIQTVKCYRAEQREDEVFVRGVDNLFTNVARTITGGAAVGSASIIIVGGVVVAIFLVGGRAILAGTMTLGDLAMYVAFTAVMVAPLTQIAGVATQLSDAFSGLDRIRELLDLETESDEDQGKAPLGSLHGDIVFENVEFEYEPGVPVLKGIDFEARAATTTALVGPSGAGKSTVIGLAMGFHRPTGGRILVDGRDLSSIRLADYRSTLGVVLQENFLFDGTVADNIRYARPSATDEDVRLAAEIAHCDEFVSRFKDGYDTVVGERGVKLSGGERQRVSIARAVLANPRILILDEATSSLDSENEALIQDGLRSLRSGRTTFVIAHRLSTIRSADQILVLDGGRIVERGDHHTLLEKRGRYKKLYDRQYAAEADRYTNPGEEFSVRTEKAAEDHDDTDDELPMTEAMPNVGTALRYDDK